MITYYKNKIAKDEKALLFYVKMVQEHPFIIADKVQYIMHLLNKIESSINKYLLISSLEGSKDPDIKEFAEFEHLYEIADCYKVAAQIKSEMPDSYKNNSAKQKAFDEEIGYTQGSKHKSGFMWDGFIFKCVKLFSN